MELTTKTANGNQVTLSPREINGTPGVLCTLVHPKAGTVHMRGTWTTFKGKHGVGGHSTIKGKLTYVLCEIPRKDYDAVIEAGLASKQAKDEADQQAAIQACPAGFIPCRRVWANGDLMSAEYATIDGLKILASDMLEGHSGWFWLPEADVEVKRTKRADALIAKAARLASETTRRDAIFSTAKTTGERQALRSWMTEDCTENLIDCSFDSATEWAMPNGTTKTTYRHCH